VKAASGNDGLKDKIMKCIGDVTAIIEDKKYVRTMLVASLGSLVIAITFFATVWSQSKEVPTLISEGKNRESRLTQTETRVKTLEDRVTKFEENQQKMLSSLSRIEGKLSAPSAEGAR
jgi:flagellar biosynthesis/type III secretory pathway M-ring protein FliF/YscJ